MVLELLLKPMRAEKQPIDMFVMGFAVSSIGLWLAYFVQKTLPQFIFKEHVSSWFLFFTSLSLVVLINRVLIIEESKETTLHKATLMERHREVIFMYIFLFFGLIVAYSFWFTILPQSLALMLFQDQWTELLRIQGLRSTLIGSLLSVPTGYFILNSEFFMKGFGFLKVIVINNLRLLFLFTAFSFIFGAGAILLLTWNAAVVGVAMGALIKETIGATASILLKTKIYLTALPMSFMGFFVHGIFEVLAYFIGAIAGGIFSVAITRKHYKNERHFNRIINDVSILILVATGLIILGAVVEVYVTPFL